MKVRRAVAIIHDEKDVTGSLGQVLAELNICLEVRTVFEPLPDPGSLELLFVMGSPESAHDDSLPWIKDELAWLQKVLAADVPVMGICFGSQIIARSIGGRVLPLETPEIGFMTVEPTGPGWRYLGPWLNFHFDTFLLPEGASLLSITPLAPQSYRIGRCWAVQFHPEITPEMFDTWVRYWQSTFKGAAFLGSSKVLVADIRRQIEQNEALCRHNFSLLLKDFLVDVGIAPAGQEAELVVESLA